LGSFGAGSPTARWTGALALVAHRVVVAGCVPVLHPLHQRQGASAPATSRNAPPASLQTGGPGLALQ
jgi:hypothetical protein